MNSLDALLAPGLLAAAAIRKNSASADCPQTKADATPVTAADIAAHHAAVDWLQLHDPTCPVLSEEAALPTPDFFAQHKSFALLDPLDGTTEFVAGRKEYGVSIGWVKQGFVHAGIIVAPALGEVAWGMVGKGAWHSTFDPALLDNLTAENLDAWIQKHLANRKALRIDALRPSPETSLRILCTRSHHDPETSAHLANMPNAKRISVGACLKFVRLAQGLADYYPRLKSLHAWDIAGGHGILKAAGGNVYQFGTQIELRYDAASLGVALETPCFEAWAFRS